MKAALTPRHELRRKRVKDHIRLHDRILENRADEGVGVVAQDSRVHVREAAATQDLEVDPSQLPAPGRQPPGRPGGGFKCELLSG
eukprot:CAMPEP_0194291508 /NCGR_PEP_ID=MMETSP0169-20130528/43526_1 /TAXON_ID=218684 /ORGANISM="Corethron pennatum, Strain L29A3" /LENGTH=84 /DNA_ID=CAMNT_0039039411 /DNA_START=313 /DNA_END=566 /DNA_ORIENTATION=-